VIQISPTSNLDPELITHVESPHLMPHSTITTLMVFLIHGALDTIALVEVFLFS